MKRALGSLSFAIAGLLALAFLGGWVELVARLGVHEGVGLV